MRKIYIILFLSFSNFILAQENGLKSETLMNDEFQEWVNDTLPLIRSQYNILYVEDDSVGINGIEIINVFNVNVENGKPVYLEGTSEMDYDGNVTYVLCELSRFHSKLPQFYNLHIEAKTYYHPCPYYFSKYEYKTIDYNVLLYTDSYWVSYNFYKYIDGAYVYNKKTKETKYLYLEELRGIYDKLK